MVKKILLPLDGSDHAFKALDFASDLAEKYGAVLLVLYVVTKHELPESVRRFAQVEHIEGPPNWIYDEVVAKNVLRHKTGHSEKASLQSRPLFAMVTPPSLLSRLPAAKTPILS
jgi:nucleotide-binding universal stress UspA family protein